MKFNTYGLDIAKNIFHVFTITEDGEIIKKKFTRAKLLKFFSRQTKGLIGIEACGSSHHWARELIKLGHEVILMNPKHGNQWGQTRLIFDSLHYFCIESIDADFIDF